MSEQEQQENGHNKSDPLSNIQLSAFIDGEQSDVEISQTIDALLNDSKYKNHYARTQLINDHMNDQVSASISFDQSDSFNKLSFCNKLRDNISLALDDLPAHFTDDAVSLQNGKIEDITQKGWFNRFFDNKLVSGLSVAASVMFVTLFTLQGFNNTNSDANLQTAQLNDLNSSTIAFANPPISTPSLIQSASSLPASYVSTGSINKNQLMKQQYQWIEADPVLSNQVRRYVNEHETRRAGYNLQPKIRTATYRVSE